METILQIGGMRCEHCAKAVQKAIEVLPGVDRVSVNLEQSSATVQSQDRLDRQAILASLEEEGYKLLSDLLEKH